MTDTALIIEGVVAQVWRSTPMDELQAPEVGVLLQFGAGQVVCGMLWDGEALSLPPVPEPPLPIEIPMHKARKALRIMGPLGEDDPTKWWPQVMAAIEAIPNEISRGCIMDELDTAPNLVLAGDSTTMVRAAIGMTDEQLEMVARKALTLP